MARLAYLDQCFKWRGYANRSDLADKFGISATQAGFDYREYLEWCLEPVPTYDNKSRAYVATDTHAGLPECFDHLPNYPVIADGACDRFECVPTPSRHCPPLVMRHLYHAMKYARRIEVTYLSMASGKWITQWIVPARIGSDGDRLHFRAWSCRHAEWRDFIPVRVAESSSFSVEPLDSPLPRDNQWETRVSIDYCLKLNLSAEQQRAVREEYGMIGDSLTLETNLALASYLDRLLGVDDPDALLERRSVKALEEELSG